MHPPNDKCLLRLDFSGRPRESSVSRGGDGSGLNTPRPARIVHCGAPLRYDARQDVAGGASGPRARAFGGTLMPSRWIVRLGKTLLFGAALLASAVMREGPSTVVNQAIIWLPSGVALAGLWLFGRSYW